MVFAHNDLLLGNILVDENTDEVRFIDYEYAAYNFQAYDIGNHFAEYAGWCRIRNMVKIEITNTHTHTVAGHGDRDLQVLTVSFIVCVCVFDFFNKLIIIVRARVQ